MSIKNERIKDLQQLMECGDKFVSDTAAMALEISDAEALGHITAEQAHELIEDLVRTENIEGKSEDIILVGQLVTGVMGLASVM